MNKHTYRSNQVSHLPLPKTGNPQPLSQSEDIGIRGGQIRTTISRTVGPLSNSRAGSVELFTTYRLANPVSTPDPDRSTIPVPVQEFGAFSPALRTSRRRGQHERVSKPFPDKMDIMF